MHKFYISSKILFIFFVILFSSLAFSQPSVSDNAITSNVKSKISNERSLSDTNVAIFTKKGIVTISGEVETDGQAGRMIEIIQSTPGVKDVDASRLNTRISSHSFSDVIITSKVKGLYIQEKLFGVRDIAPLTIGVRTSNGEVILSGTVSSREQAKNAQAIAKRVKGVKKVTSNLKIIPEE